MINELNFYFYSFTLVILIIYTQSYYISPGDHTNITINNFAFGSCFYGKYSTKLDTFKSILKENPQLWVWLGDAAYVDKTTIFDIFKSTINVNLTWAKEIFNESKNNKCIKIN